MGQLKLQHLYEGIKADFEQIAKAYNVDLQGMANEAVKSGIWPTLTMWNAFNEICTQKQSDDMHPVWEHRLKNNLVGRIVPFVAHDWANRAIYDTYNDTHVDSLLRRVLVSFANPDLA